MLRKQAAFLLFWVIFLAVHFAFAAEKPWSWTPARDWHSSVGVIKQSGSQGTAFLVDSQHIATAAHCCDKGNRATWTVVGREIGATVVWRGWNGLRPAATGPGGEFDADSDSRRTAAGWLAG